MFRGSRLIVLALAGLALIGAAKPTEKERAADQSDKQAEISESLKSIATTLTSTAKPNETRHPCGPKQYDSNDDLCAQWKAADSAADAAEWGWWQMLWSGIGVLIGGVTMFAAIKAALFARDAASATNRSADIAWDVGLAQSSPYITIGNGHGFQSNGEDGAFKIFVEVANHGPAPAISIIPFGIFYAGDFQQPDFAVRVKWSKKRQNAVGAHQSTTLDLAFADPKKNGMFDTLKRDMIYPGSILLGLRYADEFGNIWVQRQRISVEIWVYGTSVIPEHWKFEGNPNKIAPPRKRLVRAAKR
jgi:hypothetical protein